jgi:hypothetical protein
MTTACVLQTAQGFEVQTIRTSGIFHSHPAPWPQRNSRILAIPAGLPLPQPPLGKHLFPSCPPSLSVKCHRLQRDGLALLCWDICGTAREGARPKLDPNISSSALGRAVVTRLISLCSRSLPFLRPLRPLLRDTQPALQTHMTWNSITGVLSYLHSNVPLVTITLDSNVPLVTITTITITLDSNVPLVTITT